MRLACARTPDGTVAWGPVHDGRLHDVRSRWPSPAAMVAAATDADGRASIAEVAGGADGLTLDSLTFLPPVPEPRRVLCIGVNYADHATESDRAVGPTEHPVVFTRFASSLVGHQQPLVRPVASTQFDYEGELAVVIGQPVRHVPAEQALRAVAGYSCFMDGTIRDYQRHTSQFTPGKNFDRSGAWGPSIVTVDELDDPRSLTLVTTLDGEVVQSASTAQMIHDVASIISYCARFTTLEPGDVIATGTPGGVGYARRPQRWLQPGSEVSVTIDGVATLTNRVVDESSLDETIPTTPSHRGEKP